MLDGEKGEEIVKTLIEWCGKKGEKTIVQLQDVRNKVGPGHIQNQGKSYVLVQKSDLRKVCSIPSNNLITKVLAMHVEVSKQDYMRWC